MPHGAHRDLVAFVDEHHAIVTHSQTQGTTLSFKHFDVPCSGFDEPMQRRKNASCCWYVQAAYISPRSFFEDDPLQRSFVS
jgi:hypothetical protein